MYIHVLYCNIYTCIVLYIHYITIQYNTIRKKKKKRTHARTHENDRRLSAAQNADLGVNQNLGAARSLSFKLQIWVPLAVHILIIITRSRHCTIYSKNETKKGI